MSDLCNQDGTVTIQNGLLAGNSANGGAGGGVYNSGDDFGGVGTLTVSQSSVIGNSANTGGGIDNDVGGVLTVQSGVVVGNAAPPGAARTCTTLARRRSSTASSSPWTATAR